MRAAGNAVRAPRRVRWMDTEYKITVDRHASGGVAGAFESTVPGGSGPPIHVHHNEDEIIHVVESPYDFWLDGAVVRKLPGESIFLPRGVPHTFRVAGDRPGRNLTLLTPGGLEEFFVEAATRELKIPAHMAEVVELAGRYGIEFRGQADWS